MPVVTLELNATKETVGQPIIWRLGKLFNVVTNIRRARVSEDYGFTTLDVEGSTKEVEQATSYLKSLNMLKDSSVEPLKVTLAAPENEIPQANTIFVHLSTVTAAQAHSPILYRVGKDFGVVVNIERAAFDAEEGGSIDVTLSGTLNEVQRAIAYLHTTGIHVNPRQRSVTDFGNL